MSAFQDRKLLRVSCWEGGEPRAEARAVIEKDDDMATAGAVGFFAAAAAEGFGFSMAAAAEVFGFSVAAAASSGGGRVLGFLCFDS